jgi:integrase
MPGRFRCIVLLAGFGGLRLGELLGLTRAYVNPLHGTLRVDQQQQQLAHGEIVLGPPKTEKGRRPVALPDLLVRELEAHLAQWTAPDADARVFAGERGGPLRPHVLRKHWLRARTSVDGLPDGFVFHDLRHTAHTLAADTGASTATLMQRLGHATPAAALRYQHATRDRDAETARRLNDVIARVDDVSNDGRAMAIHQTPPRDPA